MISKSLFHTYAMLYLQEKDKMHENLIQAS